MSIVVSMVARKVKQAGSRRQRRGSVCGYGSVDVPLGWPLRYSHSPAEVIDTRDLDALGKIVAVIARNW